MKFKYVNNIDCFGKTVIYLTVGKVYEFDMEDENFGRTTSDDGAMVLESFLDSGHGKWELVEE